MATTTHRNRLSCAVSAVASSGLGAFTISTAQSGFRTFVAGDNGATFDVEVQEGTAWEVRTGCVYTSAGTSLSRGTLEDSSTGSAIAFTSAAIVTECLTAGKAAKLEQQLDRGFVYVRNDGTTTQALNNTTVKVAAAFTTVVSDPNSWWDNTNKKFLPNRAGKYQFIVQVTQANGATSILYPYLYKNGTVLLQGPGAGLSANTVAGMTGIIDLNGSTDYVEMFCYAALSVNSLALAEATWFQAIYLGP